MVEFDVEERVDYTRYSNRQLAAIPLVVLALALLVILGWSVVLNGSPADPGWPVNPGIEFTGGTELQVQNTTRAELESTFGDRASSIRAVGPPGSETDTFIVTFPAEEADAANATGDFDVVGARSTSPSFGAQTQMLAVYGVGTAFVGMSVVIFLLFRTAVPSLGVVYSAFSDMAVPVALMNLLGIELSLGTVAALLMLIGYSVDSDILLTNQVLRRRGGFYESTYKAMRTGVTMTLTSLSAVTVMAIVAFVLGVDLIASIGIVLAFGLATDLMNTYMINVGLLRWYRGLDA